VYISSQHWPLQLQEGSVQISTKKLVRVTIVSVKGRVDHDTSQQLAQTLSELLRSRQFNLVVDLSGVEYISSAGLRALLAAHKETQAKHHGDVRLAAPSLLVRESLDVVGFDKIFKIYADLVEAVGSF
jgi:anti-sigma B factor antagonist